MLTAVDGHGRAHRCILYKVVFSEEVNLTSILDWKKKEEANVKEFKAPQTPSSLGPWRIMEQG